MKKKSSTITKTKTTEETLKKPATTFPCYCISYIKLIIYRYNVTYNVGCNYH